MTVFAAEGDAGGIGEASCVEIADFEAPTEPCWDSRVDCSKFSRGSPPPVDTAVGGSLPPSLWPGTSLPWAALGEHSLSAVAFDSSLKLARTGNWKFQEALATRGRALVGSAAAGAGAHWVSK